MASFDSLAEFTIALVTKSGTPIKNIQSREFSNFEAGQFAVFDRKYPLVRKRTEPNPIYNCHGLTFASRRTQIFQSSDIQIILKEDGYTEIDKSSVLAGDVIVYFDPNGDAEHSGIVVAVLDGPLKSLSIVSKWGKYRELIHSEYDCPYNLTNIKYYRVTKWK